MCFLAPKPAPSCDKNVVLNMPADVKGYKAAAKFILDTSTGEGTWKQIRTKIPRHYLHGASNRPPRRHRIQDAEGPVLDPCAKQMYFRRDLKVDPLRIESGPSWRACFWSLHFVRFILKLCRLLLLGDTFSFAKNPGEI